MKRTFLLVLVWGLMCLTCANAQQVNRSPVDTTNQTEINRAIFQRIYNKLKPDASLPMPELVVKVALEFVGTPYQGFSLEAVPEQLRVFLNQTDCILFVELSTCFALTIKGLQIVQASDGMHYIPAPKPSVTTAKPSYELLVENIRQMRYRVGIVDGYASRIHYTSEWLMQNEANGILQELSQSIGEAYTQDFFFMSMHPKSYFQLSNDPCQLGLVRLVEQRLSEAHPYFEVSQQRLMQDSIISQIHSGDIICFQDRHPGLDIAHVAIAYEIDGQMHFIHASSRGMKVMVEPMTLAQYAKNGIRFARLK